MIYIISFPIVWLSLLAAIIILHIPAVLLTPVTIPGWFVWGWKMTTKLTINCRKALIEDDVCGRKDGDDWYECFRATEPCPDPKSRWYRPMNGIMIDKLDDGTLFIYLKSYEGYTLMGKIFPDDYKNKQLCRFVYEEAKETQSHCSSSEKD